MAKKPIKCIEFIIAHELIHLLECNHNERFVAFMDRFMTQWKQYREELNRMPVANVEWGYTTKVLSDFLVKHLFSKNFNQSEIKILEPSSGDGKFIESLLSSNLLNQFKEVRIKLLDIKTLLSD